MRILLLSSLLFICSCLSPQALQKASESGPSSSPCMKADIDDGLRDPKSIDEAMELINNLPKPVELRCLLRVLKRPLYVNATTSTLSAQKAGGAESPRIFIFKDDLILSFLPDGSGSYLLEFSELLSDRRSVKGEIELPVYGELSPSEPYRQINNPGQTSCSGCHMAERLERTTSEGEPVYSSYALKPTDKQDLPLSELEHQLYLCDLRSDASRRCEIFRELLSNGEVRAQDFPASMFTLMDTFGQNS